MGGFRVWLGCMISRKFALIGHVAIGSTSPTVTTSHQLWLRLSYGRQEPSHDKTTLSGYFWQAHWNLRWRYCACSKGFGFMLVSICLHQDIDLQCTIVHRLCGCIIYSNCFIVQQYRYSKGQVPRQLSTPWIWSLDAIMALTTTPGPEVLCIHCLRLFYSQHVFPWK